MKSLLSTLLLSITICMAQAQLDITWQNFSGMTADAISCRMTENNSIPGGF